MSSGLQKFARTPPGTGRTRALPNYRTNVGSSPRIETCVVDLETGLELIEERNQPMEEDDRHYEGRGAHQNQ
jgi:hypothetical protein